jgi:MoxR-like ATPase
MNDQQRATYAANTNHQCSICHDIKHVSNFYVFPDGHVATRCRTCDKQAKAATRHPKGTRQRVTVPALAEAVETGELQDEYVASPEVIATFATVQRIAALRDPLAPAPNLLYTGPSGSGKTRAAKHLAKLANLPFVKVDAPSMTDPEAWFGTREVVVIDGSPKTEYRPSVFVKALGTPCILLIDEVNRVTDFIRGILLSLLDDSREATNPITGETIVRHPDCFIVMTGNVGLQFTGTYAIDPAFYTRALTTPFGYMAVEDEVRVAMARTRCSEETARLFVRFAGDSRVQAAADPDFIPVSTREVINACRLVAQGLDIDVAARQTVINAASDDGGAQSRKATLDRIWLGLRPSGTSASWLGIGN